MLFLFAFWIGCTFFGFVGDIHKSERHHFGFVTGGWEDVFLSFVDPGNSTIGKILFSIGYFVVAIFIIRFANAIFYAFLGYKRDMSRVIWMRQHNYRR